MLGHLQWGATGWADELAYGLAVTMALAVSAYACGLVIGLLAAWGRLSRRRILRTISQAYSELGRCVPELIILFLVYYGGALLLTHMLALIAAGSRAELNAFAAGIVALALVSGAFASEVFRAAMLAVPRGQREAAAALGLRPVAAFALVIAPQMLRHALPGLANVWIMLLKDTAIVSIIGLEDLLRFAGIAAGVTREPFTFYAAAGALYLAVTALSTAIKDRVAVTSKAGVPGEGRTR